MATLNPKVQAWKDKWNKEFQDMDTKYKAWEKEDWEKNQSTYKTQGYNRIEDPNSVWGSKWSYTKPIEQNPTPVKKDHGEDSVSKVPEEVTPIPETIARPQDEEDTNPYASPWSQYAQPSTTPAKPKKVKEEQGFWGSFFKRGFQGLGLYSDPAVATASGWRHDQSGNIVQDQQNDEQVTKLRNNLAAIAGTAQGVTNVAAKVANWGTSQPLLTSNVAANQAALPGPMNILRDQFGNIIASWKRGGTMNKVQYFAGGGQPQAQNQQQNAFMKAVLNGDQGAIGQLIQLANQGDQNATQLIQTILQEDQKGNAQVTKAASVIKQLAQGAVSAKWGSKLDYVRSLKFGKGGKSCPVCEQQKVEMKKCGGKKAKKHQTGGEFYFNETNPMRMSNGRNVVGIVNRETFKNPTNIGISQTVYNQQGRPVVQKDKTSNGGEREIYYNVPKSIKRKGFIGSRYEMGNDTVYVSGTPEMFQNSPNMSTSEKMNQANRFAYGM